jgi:RNA polymerase sigma factor (sigma-70 family)
MTTAVSDGRAAWLARNVLPHEPSLRAWLSRRRVFDLEIDDIVQETYAKLAALQTVELIREPRSYMFQTANSVVLSHLRRSRIVSISAAADLDQFGIATTEPGPDQRLEYRDELQELISALASLPKPCRDAFTLRRVACLSQKETAKHLGVSEKTVEKYMAKSVRLLMDIFGRGGKSASAASSFAKNINLPGKRAVTNYAKEADKPGG